MQPRAHFIDGDFPLGKRTGEGEHAPHHAEETLWQIPRISASL
jgi:hypothetical protein